MEVYMEKMIAYCGLVCTDCPAYLATKAGDEKKAQETAALWKKEYGIDVSVADVWCDGCLVAGKKCAHCAECEIRACGIEKGVTNCGRCADFACAKIEGFFKMAPFARDVLQREAQER
jgi:hypothetical protein